MKQIKRLTTLALAVMLLLILAIPAFAADGDGDGYTVTINNATGHSYVIYQIFTGDLSQKQIAGAGTEVTTDDKYVEVLSNIKFGTDYTPDGAAVGAEVPETILNAVNADPTSIDPTGTGTAMTNNENGTATATGLAAGYYMIEDVTTNLPAGEAASKIMFQVVGNTEVTSKHPKTTIVKKVQDINDSTGEQPKDNGSVWIDSADYDMGDTVPFKSTATFEGMANYKTYKVIFTDIMAPGLDYNNDMKVYVNGTECTANFEIETSAYANAEDPDYNGGTKITVTCDDIKVIDGVDNHATIVLEYSATLNSNAKLGAPGNPNKIRVKTIPDGEGEKETPWDVNIVFTYKLESNKYADEVKKGNELTGAGFTLFKWIKDDSEAGGAWVQIGNEVKGEEMTKFEWKGIDDGKYKLEETTTPAGYNTIDPIEFEVVAEHVIVADNPTLTNLTGETETGEIEFSADATSGIVSTDVVNKSGTVLPETGGIGTTIFYTVGAIMVLVAVVLLVTKKRMTYAE